MTKWILLAALSLIACSKAPSSAAQETTMLTIRTGSKTVSFTPTALVERPDSRQIVVLQDAAYRKPMIYRAVPLAALLQPFAAPPNAILATIARGGFVTRIPLDRIIDADPTRAIAFIAIENPRQPWPALPRSQASAGPFHLVWLGADAHRISRDQWPSQIVRLETLPRTLDPQSSIAPIERLRRPCASSFTATFDLPPCLSRSRDGRAFLHCRRSRMASKFIRPALHMSSRHRPSVTTVTENKKPVGVEKRTTPNNRHGLRPCQHDRGDVGINCLKWRRQCALIEMRHHRASSRWSH